MRPWGVIYAIAIRNIRMTYVQRGVAARLLLAIALNWTAAQSKLQPVPIRRTGNHFDYRARTRVRALRAATAFTPADSRTRPLRLSLEKVAASFSHGRWLRNLRCAAIPDDFASRKWHCENACARALCPWRSSFRPYAQLRAEIAHVPLLIYIIVI